MNIIVLSVGTFVFDWIIRFIKIDLLEMHKDL